MAAGDIILYPSSSSPPSDSSSPTLSRGPLPAAAPLAVLGPCAACKVLRRRCIDKCTLAPYFPPSEPQKFTNAHRVFGASNIIKLLQEVPQSQRADAVSSLVYEANARVRDPVYGCAGAVFQLQKQVGELEAQLARAQAEVVNAQAQNANLMALICMKMSNTWQDSSASPAAAGEAFHAAAASPCMVLSSDSFFADDGSLEGAISLEEPLWT